MKRIMFIVSIIVLIILAGCCKKVLIPPTVDLKQLDPIAIIEFAMSQNAQGELAGLTTERFVEFMRLDQPGIRIIELGNEEEVLAELGMKALNYEAFKAIGEKYGVRNVITGYLEISDIEPKVKLNLAFPYVSASAKIRSELTAKMYDTEIGANMWTGSSWANREIGSIKLFEKYISFNAENPDEAYGKLVNDLVYYATLDFREKWECQRK